MCLVPLASYWGPLAASFATSQKTRDETSSRQGKGIKRQHVCRGHVGRSTNTDRRRRRVAKSKTTSLMREQDEKDVFSIDNRPTPSTTLPGASKTKLKSPTCPSSTSSCSPSNIRRLEIKSPMCGGPLPLSSDVSMSSLIHPCFIHRSAPACWPCPQRVCILPPEGPMSRTAVAERRTVRRDDR